MKPPKRLKKPKIGLTAAPRVSLPECAGKNLERVVLGEGMLARNDVYVHLRDERGWPQKLREDARLVGTKRVRLVIEVLL